MQNKVPNVSPEARFLAHLLRDCGFSYESMTDKTPETLRASIPNGDKYKNKKIFNSLYREVYDYAEYRYIKAYDEMVQLEFEGHQLEKQLRARKK